MGKAYSEDLAWRVVARVWLGQTDAEIADACTGLDVSETYVRDVYKRYTNTGTVATHQGQRKRPASPILNGLDHSYIVQYIVANPRLTLKQQHCIFREGREVEVSYRTFCQAVHFLQLSRGHVRAVCYKADRDRAAAWLSEMLT